MVREPLWRVLLRRGQNVLFKSGLFIHNAKKYRLGILHCTGRLRRVRCKNKSARILRYRNEGTCCGRILKKLEKSVDFKREEWSLRIVFMSLECRWRKPQNNRVYWGAKHKRTEDIRSEGFETLRGRWRSLRVYVVESYSVAPYLSERMTWWLKGLHIPICKGQTVIIHTKGGMRLITNTLLMWKAEISSDDYRIQIKSRIF